MLQSHTIAIKKKILNCKFNKEFFFFVLIDASPTVEGTIKLVCKDFSDPPSQFTVVPTKPRNTETFV